MDVPIIDLMDPDACYGFLLDLLHPDGLRCPRCHRADGLGVQARRRAPALDYRCSHCGRVSNADTGTRLPGNRRSPTQLGLILRGIAQGIPTARLARELGCDRMHLLGLRHRLQELAAEAGGQGGPAPGAEAEADEMPQNAGGKGFRTRTRPTHPAAGRTSGGGMGTSPTTARRWPGWPVGRRERWSWRWPSGPTRSP